MLQKKSNEKAKSVTKEWRKVQRNKMRSREENDDQLEPEYGAGMF